MRLSVLGSDPDNGVSASAPVQVLTSIIGAATGPVLARDRPFETEAGVRLPALSPGMRFRVRGQNLVANDGTWPSVSIGGRALSVSDATASQIVVVTPDDLPTNVEMQLLVQLGDAASTPEPVLIAPSWPAVSAPAVGSTLTLTGLTRETARRLKIDGVEVTRNRGSGRRPVAGPFGSGCNECTFQHAAGRAVVDGSVTHQKDPPNTAHPDQANRLSRKQLTQDEWVKPSGLTAVRWLALVQIGIPDEDREWPSRRKHIGHRDRNDESAQQEPRDC